ncbi:hypothetical protein [Mycobacteroides abscessus]|uniref:hypothetical protein n=2 Tax=Mycobacteroides abscessus TaxID=36809 RepID=UPI0002317515|nr:hypothetical protein [Mycobacteroides abscessus]QST89196.1 hypothetical protein PROPHIGD44-1_9 [Mycobacterium phage prophiGD44-1]AWG57938.1 hypothetical protein DDT47_02100 [Mycobacteroides abscessus]EHB98375.1 hypothetical protein MAB47J26_14312 [Mycobacteroides abscessus 47J26]MBN7419531.1 hypothetical protein [Mycobacteroides abscessus subsp. massiliense]MDM2160844.1 hypothetical protein [Mycobacteroides abscessus]
MTAMTIDVDESYETNMRVLKGMLYRLVEAVRDTDPHQVHRELVSMWLRHPVKAAQLMMALAIGFDPDTVTTKLLDRRAEEIAGITPLPHKGIEVHP